MLLKVRELNSIYLSTAKLDNPFVVGKDGMQPYVIFNTVTCIGLCAYQSSFNSGRSVVSLAINFIFSHLWRETT